MRYTLEYHRRLSRVQELSILSLNIGLTVGFFRFGHVQLAETYRCGGEIEKYINCLKTCRSRRVQCALCSREGCFQVWGLWKRIRVNFRWVCSKIIPIDNVKAMKMFQGAKEFSSVESASILVKFSLTLKMVEQFSTVDYTTFQLRRSDSHETHQRTCRGRVYPESGTKTWEGQWMGCWPKQGQSSRREYV